MTAPSLRRARDRVDWSANVGSAFNPDQLVWQSIVARVLLDAANVQMSGMAASSRLAATREARAWLEGADSEIVEARNFVCEHAGIHPGWLARQADAIIERLKTRVRHEHLDEEAMMARRTAELEAGANRRKRRAAC